MITTLPRPGAWVARIADGNGRPQIAQVKKAYSDFLSEGSILLDLVFYTHAGLKVGRESPPMGGPKGFEPACSGEFWTRIQAPEFQLLIERTYTWDDLLNPLPEGLDEMLNELVEGMERSPQVPREISLDGPEFDAAQEAEKLGLVEFIGNGVLVLTDKARRRIQKHTQEAY